MAQHEPLIAGLAGRYATALFDLAVEEKALERIERDLATLRAALDESADLARLVRAPVFSRDEQTRAMRAVLGKLDTSPLATRFVLLLAQKRRLFALADVIRAFETLLARHRGEVSARVKTARPLGDPEIAELKRILKDKLGRDAKLALSVEPELLGGIVVQVGSRMIDSSLRAKLDALRAAMRGS